MGDIDNILCMSEALSHMGNSEAGGVLSTLFSLRWLTQRAQAGVISSMENGSKAMAYMHGLSVLVHCRCSDHHAISWHARSIYRLP